MKRYVLLALMLGCLALMMAQATIEKIEISFDNPVVTRVVISVSTKSDWTHTIDKDYNLLYVTVKDCAPGSPIVSGMAQNYMIKDVNTIESTVNGLVVLTVDKPFFVETMTLDNPFRIVTDLFVSKDTYTYQDLLNHASFYEKSKKWNAANRTYTKILQQYPRNLDTYYHWGNLLVRQGRNESAVEKYNQVPQSSQYFQASQRTIARLTGTELPESEVDIAETESELSDTLAAATIASPVAGTPVRPQRTISSFNIFDFKTMFSNWNIGGFFTRIFNWAKSLPIWLWIIVLVILAIIDLIFFDIQRIKKQKGRIRPQKIKIKADNSVRQGMISKLLDHGWQEPEIARELLITLKEVSLYLKKIKKEKRR